MPDDEDDDFLNDEIEGEPEAFLPVPARVKADSTDSDPVRRIVSQFVHVTRWPFCECPSGRPHKSVRVLFKDGLPYVHCFHPSCATDRATVNAQIADAFRALPMDQRRFLEARQNPEERRLLRQKREAYDIAKRRLLPELLKNPVLPDYWLKCSPFPIAEVPVEH